MPADSQKEILIKITADAAKAAEEIKRLQGSLRESRYEEQLAKAAGDEHKTALIEKRKALEEYRDKLKDANEGARNLRKAMDEGKVAVSNFGDALKGAFLGRIVADFTSNIVVALKRAGDAYRKFVGDIGNFPDLVRDISDNVDNMFSDIAIARTVDIGTKLGWTRKEIENVIKASIEYSRTNKTDMKSSLEAVTNAIVSGEVEALRRLGIIIPETGTKVEKITKAKAALADVAAKVAAVTTNEAEAFEKLKNQTDRVEVAFGKYISKIEMAGKITVAGLGKLVEDLVWLGQRITPGGTLMLRQKAIEDQIARENQVKQQAKEADDARRIQAAENYEKDRRTQLKADIDARNKITEQSWKEIDAIKARENEKKKILIAAKNESDKIADDILKDENERLKKHIKFKNDARVAERKSRAAAFVHNQKEDEKIRVQVAKSSLAKMQEEYKEYFDSYKKHGMSASELTQRLADDEIEINRKKAEIVRRGNIEEYRAYREKVKLIKSVREAIEEEQKARRLATAEMISSGAQTIALSIAGARSFEEFQARIAQAALGALQSMSFAKVTENTALGLAELARFNFGSAAQYFGAAALWGVLGTGAAVGSAAIGSSSDAVAFSSGGYGGGSLSGGRSGGPPQADQKTENVTNIYLKGRYGLITRKELRAMGKSIYEGKR